MLDLARFDYLAVLVVGGVAGWVMLERQIPLLLRTPAYWAGTLMFCALSYGVDRLAQRWYWWDFSSARTMGIFVLSVPLEEYILFFGGYLFTVAAWEELGLDTPHAVD